MKLAVVMPVGPGREENMLASLASLESQTIKPECIVVVHDGQEAFTGQVDGMTIPTIQAVVPKHEPGMEQPRNFGVRVVEDHFPDVDHVWFVDSDIIFRETACEEYHKAHAMEFIEKEPGGRTKLIDRILIGPYEWLHPGQRTPDESLHNDPRWVSFSKHAPGTVFQEAIDHGLACFSGNLVWPIDRFKEIGGFWNELHHGRCEDGELGLRATALGVPISFVREARGWHLYHEVNHPLAEQRNARDVPMLNARHPWVQGEGLAVVPKDGRRFDALCPTCQQLINTIEMWTHAAICGKTPDEGTIIPTPMT